MSKITTLEERQSIKLMVEQNFKSPEIAQQLGISVWTVRKWRQRIKKGTVFILAWVDGPSPYYRHLQLVSLCK